MKIVDVQAYPVRIPRASTSIPGSPLTTVIVKVLTDEGITGIGESFGYFNSAPVTAKAISLLLTPLLIGKDPAAIPEIWESLYRASFYYGRAGIMLSAISGVEIALWDIAGKVAGEPLYNLLGGKKHEKLQGYASVLPYPTPADVAKACTELVGRGYTALKPHEKTVAAVAAIREAVGDDVMIMLDAMCAWNAYEALKIGKQMEAYNLYWLEEPVWPGDDYIGLAMVRAEVKAPVASGENEYTARAFQHLIREGAADIVQPSVFKMGGITEEKKVFRMAEAAGLRVEPHCWSFGPARAATLHVCFSEAVCRFVEVAEEDHEASVLTKPLLPEKGFWTVPGGPGLGIEVDEAVLTKYLAG